MSFFVTEGNAVADAELRFIASGKAVANVVIAVNERIRDAEGVWVDGPVSYYEVTVWGGPAEGFTAVASKGTPLVVAGALSVEEYTDHDGATRTRRRITAEHAGRSTRFAAS